jgi:uncharacterized protein (DUF952 family)
MENLFMEGESFYLDGVDVDPTHIAVEDRMAARQAYKIVNKTLWFGQLNQHGKFMGTELDLKDGFIHLSARDQVKETAQKWFKGQENLLLVCVNLSLVEGNVKWEPSRNDQLFPHIYGAISPASVLWMKDFNLSDSKQDFLYPLEF